MVGSYCDFFSGEKYRGKNLLMIWLAHEMFVRLAARSKDRGAINI